MTGEKVRTTVYLDKTAKKHLKANNINLSEYINNIVCEKAKKLGAKEPELEKEIKNLKEKLETKKKTLKQVKKEKNKLEKYLTEPRVGKNHLEWYIEKKNNGGWSEEKKQQFLEQTAENAPVNISPEKLEKKMEAFINDQ